ncbi:MAG TPA: multicopper oxidase domain-containing protein [Drouetiella sp.]
MNLLRSVFSSVVVLNLCAGVALAQGMAAEQAAEREELGKMRDEVRDIKGNINDALNSMNELNNKMVQTSKANANAHEIHLFAKPVTWEIFSGTTADCYTYNGKIPGPPIRVTEGQPVRIVLHNQLKVPTSLSIHGIVVPQSVGGLPKRDAGLVKPGEAYTYQFVPNRAGTYWYHPQVVNGEQKTKGMYGALVVEPRSGPSEDKDMTVVLSEINLGPASETGAHTTVPIKTAGGVRTYYLMNGKAAPAVPPIELRQGEKVRLRIVNASQHAIPISLSGHRFEVLGINGGDSLEPKVSRDTVTLNPSDRIDLGFTADNPGVWSFASEILDQASNDGKFPGGIACVVRYSGMSAE